MGIVRKNHIYVDYENIHEVPLSGISDKPVSLVLVIGERQKNLPITLVRQILEHSSQVELLETGCAGKDALDLVLAWHMGKKAAGAPQDFFHIISRDKAFDALVKHLRTQGIFAARSESILSLPVLQNVPAMTKGQLLESFVGKLQVMRNDNMDARPKRLKTLHSCMKAHFHKELTDEQVDELIAELQEAGFYKADGQGRLKYLK